MSETKDWRKICAACQEGEPPKDCEYFGEPDGCNARPRCIHPTCKESLVVGDMTQMREALKAFVDYSDLVCKMGVFNRNSLIAITTKAREALAKPPRNFNKCLTPKDAMLAHLEEVYDGEKVEFGDYEWCEFVKWLFAEAKGEVK